MRLLLSPRPATARRAIALGVIGLGLALSLAACRPPATSDLAATMESAPSPLAVGASRFTMSLTRGGEPLTGAKVSVELNMTHAGMVPLRAEARELGQGRYEAGPLEITMAGDSVVTVTAATGDGELTTDVPMYVRER